jgi:HAMP domain-containing protein/DNA-directed RNA polymerase subunit RPC12/RpoP
LDKDQVGGACFMLVICEDCAKKYHIDEQRLKSARAKFPCKACGHIIIVERPSTPKATSTISPVVEQKPLPAKLPQQRQPTQNNLPSAGVLPPAGVSPPAKGRGKSFAFILSLVVFIGFVITAGTFIALYFRYIPPLARQQIELRSLALAVTLQEQVRRPLQERNYLEVNQITKQMGRLPGVAYAAVVNERGLVVAGFFNTMQGFDNPFVQRVKEKGFPVDILAQNGLKAGANEGSARIQVGGRPVYDRVLALGPKGGEVHVGILAQDSDRDIRATLLSPLLLVPLLVAVVFSYLLLWLLNSFLVRPLRSLTTVANRISLGELDIAMPGEGSREVRDMATALERMRHSIRIAMERLRRPSL